MGVGYQLNATQISAAFRVKIGDKITDELALVMLTILQADSDISNLEIVV